MLFVTVVVVSVADLVRLREVVVVVFCADILPRTMVPAGPPVLDEAPALPTVGEGAGEGVVLEVAASLLVVTDGAGEGGVLDAAGEGVV